MPILEISLKNLTINENGSADRVLGENFLTATLIYPATNVSSLTTVKALRLKDQDNIDFSSKTYEDKILFKADVFGETMVTLSLTDRQEASKASKIFEKIFKSVAALALGRLTGGIGNVFLAKAVETGGGALLGSPKLAKDKITYIGYGYLSIPANITSGTYDVSLQVPTDIELVRWEDTPDDFDELFDEGEPDDMGPEITKLLYRGDKNGKITLNIKLIS